jgi:hypothetical protein
MVQRSRREVVGERSRFGRFAALAAPVINFETRP